MHHTRAFLTALVVLASVARSSSAAEPAPLRPDDTAAVRLDLVATSAPHTTSVATTQIGPELSGAVRATRSVVVTGDGALAFGAHRFGNGTRTETARASNVLLGASWRTVERPLILDLGAFAGAPLVTVPSGGITASAAAEHADRTSLGAYGPRGTWLWARNAVPLVARARLTKSFDIVRARVDLEPGLLLSVNRDRSRAAFVGAFEIALATVPLEPYVSASAVTSTRALGRDDFAQTGAATGVRWAVDRWFGSVEARLQLDGPSGVNERDQTFWGASIGTGTTF